VGKAVALAVAVFCLASGCGLDEYLPTLIPPDVPSQLSSETNPTFEINVPSADKGSNFRGYELYYKFYGDNATESNFESLSEPELTAKGFRPVCRAEDTYSGSPPSNLHRTKPLIFVQLGADRTRQFLINVRFSASVQPVVEYDGTALTTAIRRNVPDTRSGSPTYEGPKPFIQMNPLYPAYPEPPDADIGDSLWTIVKPLPLGGTGAVYCAMYALSYGVFNISTDIYSLPRYLGYVRIDTDQ
jgi:hypothetical protein